jgi:hypothetical protein
MGIDVQQLDDRAKEALYEHPIVTSLTLHQCGGKPSDYEVLTSLPNLRSVVVLDLKTSSILEIFSRCTNLQAIYLFGSYCFSQQDARLIANIQSLEFLNLYTPNFPDHCLLEFLNHPKLDLIYTTGVLLTDSTLHRLIETSTLRSIWHDSPLVTDKAMKACPPRRKALGFKQCPVKRVVSKEPG